MQAIEPGFDEATLRFYAAEAPDYAAGGPGGASRHLHVFLDRLQPGARILELGCGSGRDAEAMIARGFDIDPTDGVAAMARQAEARIGRPVRVMRFDELDAVAAYDAVWANASLLHVPWPALPRVLAAIHRALRRDGWHFASYKGPCPHERDQFGRYFNYPTRDALVDAYRRAAHWSAIEAVEGTGGGYDGRQGPWITVTARRSGQAPTTSGSAAA